MATTNSRPTIHPLPRTTGENSFVTLPTQLRTQVISLNNAATTKPFQATVKKLTQFFETYGAFHRGAGPHATQTYHQIQEAITTIHRFLGTRSDQTLLFTQNTSAAINLFVRLLALTEEDVIITSMIEHTSNNLPWLYNSRAQTIQVRAHDDGSLDYTDLEAKVATHRGRLKLIALTGASNLTGYIPDFSRIVQLAHHNNALVFIDAAQLAPHRVIDMARQGIDALAFSAHKLYAPFGLGVLALPRQILDRQPVDPGGGSIDMLGDKTILWASPENRHQTGTWNVTGILATATSCQLLMNNWGRIVRHERELVHYAAKRLGTVRGLELYVPPHLYRTEDRIGTFVFNLPGYHHALLAAILEHEYGIETRAGTICNHRLVRRWFSVTDQQQAAIEQEIAKGNRLASYGIVRASIGIGNTEADIDALVTALKTIEKSGPKLTYRPVPAEEIFEPDRK